MACFAIAELVEAWLNIIAASTGSGLTLYEGIIVYL
jgi:hypothetical protein